MAGRGDQGESAGEVLFEFTQVGQQMRVAAIDPRTSVEVVIVAPVTATRIQMQNIALAKLRRRIAASAAASEPRRF